MRDLRSLTPEQELAVERRRGSLLLAASAGSGKTAVLVERFVRAVCEDGVAPSRILAITFTERAAGELRARARARFVELGDRDAARDVEAAPIATFHGFCARLLRSHALHAGLDPEFAILDAAAAARLELVAFRRALAAFLAARRAPADRERAVDLLAAYGADRLRGMLLRVYAEQRSRGVARPALPLAAVAAELDARRAEDADANDDAALRACALLDELLRGFAREYAECRRARGALDFDDLELRARELLTEHGDVRATWSERLELLMVDELQDTNPRQLALLELLERGNLFTVGDELQAIYGFRHADVALFRRRRAELGERGAALILTRNFRARRPILEAVNTVFAARFGDAFTPLVPGREELQAAGGSRCEVGGGAGLSHCVGPGLSHGERAGADLSIAKPAARVRARASQSTVPPEPSLELLLTDRRGWDGLPDAEALAGGLPPAPLWRKVEARLLAQRVAELTAGGEVAAGEIAILLRAAGDLPVYERALQERGLRTLAAVGSFWGHQQVADLLAYLRALANPLDERALYGALASPLAGLSSDALALLALEARARGVGLWEAIAPEGAQDGVGSGDEAERDRGGRRPPRELVATEPYASLASGDRARLERFARELARERRLAPALGVAELLLRAIATSGYERHVRSLSWGERRIANIHKLLRLARRFEAAEGRGLRAFLDHAADRAALAAGSEPHAPVAGEEPDAVRLMTIHAAKGLEFPVVCLADLGRATNGAVPDLLVDGDRVGLRLANLDGAEPRPCLRHEELCQERRRAEQAEEERIVYVAMTRARERLLLSGAIDFARWPAARPGGPPIAWLAPALAAEIPERARNLQQPVLDVAVGGARMRCLLCAPATVGQVLRDPHAPAARTAPRPPRAAMLVA